MPISDITRMVLHDWFRMLLFRPVKPRTQEYGFYYLSFGLLCAAIAGAGRYWDHPQAHTWQYWGLGSVGYCFSLAFLLYLFILPLRPKNWSYGNVLIFVSMTSPPALLYALPTELVFSTDMAQDINLLFLAIVSFWRVALLIDYLRNAAKLRALVALVGAFTPILLVISVLSLINMLPVVMQGMAGNQQTQHGTSGSMADFAVAVIAFLGWYAFPGVLLAYVWFVYRARKMA